MRLRSCLVGLAVIASSFIAVKPVEAQSKNGWYKAGCNLSGECYYVKKIGGTWPFITFKENGPHGMFTEEADCQQWRTRYLRDNGTKSKWHEVMPGSIGETIMEIVCR